MDQLLTYILFAVGFAFLVKGADYLVDGASSIAKRYHIPELVIGLTIISFGTSMPELIVNLMASFDGSSEIAIGNIFGSNISNVLLILGVSAVIWPLPIQRSIYFTEIPISLVATFMVGFLANANLYEDIMKLPYDKSKALALSQFDGAILLFFFALFMGYIYVVSKLKPKPNATQSKPKEEEEDEGAIKELPLGKSYLFVIIGMAGLFFGGKWVVEGAVLMAQAAGLSKTFIGLTVIAIGTSLPELMTSAVAAYKKKADLAVGNVIGSNVFNLLWILGISASIKPLPFNGATNSDILMIIIASTLLILAIVIGKRPRIARWEGAVFVIVYFAYMYYLLQREGVA